MIESRVPHKNSGKYSKDAALQAKTSELKSCVSHFRHSSTTSLWSETSYATTLASSGLLRLPLMIDLPLLLIINDDSQLCVEAMKTSA